ncbi:energy-coupling factor transporter ATPase [Evansella cellulosilytica]|uniref:ABC transporter related protein n=1 Tax=Evansella cellulosilytica (strain ATCC 21833 / DSM 2522 / FERM P-1141 / JCM 9156 / N-4) TaxID=649639 RepID=E6U1E3_EVAC2|nr:energy-coupling factor transporter ATPase [Evansella cellulosilytica]ADU29190.1 ABC transporter related protein [Evansella cellulosilytica DSM 2522]
MSAPILEVKNLSFRYDLRSEINTVANLSFSVNKGEWLAIIGGNGSGKSTLAQLLVGLLTPLDGCITVDGTALTEKSKWRIRSKVGLVFQNPDNQFIGTTVQDDVAFSLESLNVPYEEMKLRVECALEKVGMLEYRFHDPSRLSGGQKQRVAIAGILALHPNVIIFDEAFVMLDPKGREGLLKTLRRLKEIEGVTIISITHDMNEAAAADRLLLMKNGEISQTGKPSEVFMQQRDLEPPFPEKLRRSLEKKGRHVPNQYMTEEEVVNWIWK